MKYLKITNIGLLDIRLVHLMGGTTKSNDEFKIGQFGTGLKYAMAFMLRNNIDFRIFIDEKEIKLSTVQETIRDTVFEIIFIDGERTSITTNMGLDWEAWMIIRELWCNALDEIDPNFSIVDIITPSKGLTEYYIQLVPDIKEVFDNWTKYFIHCEIPLMDTEEFAIYKGGDSLRCYKNGVLIKEITGQKAIFSYDFKNTPLNELREMRYSPGTEICDVIPHLNKEIAEMMIENISGDYYESTLDFSDSWHDRFGDGWKEAVGNAKFCSDKTYEKIVDKWPEIANEAIVIVPSLFYKAISKYFPHVSITRASDKLHEFFETYSDKLTDKIKKCKDLLESVGYFIDPNLKIITGVFGNKEIWAQISFDDKEIRLNQDLENMSDSDLIVALIEENEHFKTHFSDCTRAFQTHLLKLYSNILLKDIKVLL